MRLRIVHEGRGGYIVIDDLRYSIEHVEGGRFAIHVPRGKMTAQREAHRRELEALCAREPEKWFLDIRR